MGKATIDDVKWIYADFEKLSRKHKKEVANFIAYLRVQEEIEATNEIISDVLLPSNGTKSWFEIRSSLTCF